MFEPEVRVDSNTISANYRVFFEPVEEGQVRKGTRLSRWLEDLRTKHY